MKFDAKDESQRSDRDPGRAQLNCTGRARSGAAFTLIEVMIVMVLLTVLFIAGFSAIFFNTQASYRLADHTAAIAWAQAAEEGVRAVSYGVATNSIFRSSAYSLTSTGQFALDKAGSNYLVSGTIVTKIEPVASGHLITVTGTFATPRKPTVVTLQTVVNQFCSGQK